MKQIVVSVTSEQSEYINSLCRQLYRVRPGDLLLALAFTSLTTTEDYRVESIVSGLRDYVEIGNLPMLQADELFNVGVESRPAPLRALAS